MVMRQLKEARHQQMLDHLEAAAVQEEFSAAYDVVMTVDEMCYRLRLQPERHRKLAVLQAVSWSQKAPEQRELITDALILSSLLELLTHQATADRKI